MTADPTTALRNLIPSLTADDVQESVAFYEGVLGFEVIDRFEHEGQLMGAVFQRGPYRLMLVQDDWKKGRERAKGAGVRLYFVVDDEAALDALAESFRGHGAEFAQEPTTQSWGTRDFALFDPTGYALTFTTDWEHDGGREEE